MINLVGNHIYLAALEKVHCRQLWNDIEYDFTNLTEPLNIGHSIDKADDWFLDIQNNQGKTHIRLGIFLKSNKVIGDIALQDINWRNRSCTLGFGIAKLENRSKGYGTEAIGIILDYAFTNIGLERISANTLEQNIGAQNILCGNGFVLEGNERQSEYFAGKRWDRFNYSILRDEYLEKHMKK